ncbi:hypothetical protein DITRI_Ditri07aG0015800 [Diplodiscus trichospermus]
MLLQILSLLLAFLQYFHVDCSTSFSSSFLHSTPLCLPEHRAALLEFKNTISTIPVDDDDFCDFPKTNSWNESSDCCSWEGISCNNVSGHVIGIDLSYSCLSGLLLANNSLFHFQGLQELNLAFNYFNGSISSKLFSQLASLTHLNLCSSGFSGDIPHEISLLSNLVSLDLSLNALRFDAQGFDMIAQNLTKLRNLVLESTDMSGVAITSFLNLSLSLEHLSLGGCQLYGEFPGEVFRLPCLQHLDLNWNENLTGYLPRTNLSRTLKFLDLFSCGFRGSIPASFGNLTQIVFMDLSGNSFEGQIPDFLGNFKKLTTLRLHSCNFSGQVPLTMFNLTQLRELGLSHNRLDGPLPNHVTQLQLLERFSFSDNLISGGVPSWLFTLPSLKELDLSYNKLTGPIQQIQKPNSIRHIDLRSNNIHGNLVALESLDLSSNMLDGRIPSQLANMTFLEVLDISENDLVGPIPHGNQFDTFDNDSYSNNSRLCGLPLSKQCGERDGPKPPAPMTVGHEGFAIPFIWKVAMMGYGCGVVLGLSMGYIVFTTGRPWLFVRMIERDWQKKVSMWINKNKPKRN